MMLMFDTPFCIIFFSFATQHDLDELNKEKHLDYRQEDVICDAFFAFIGAIYIDQVS